LLPNDVANGKVAMVEFFEAVNYACNRLMHNNTGYWRMRMVLTRKYDTRIPR
jgi:hypothetical protein